MVIQALIPLVLIAAGLAGGIFLERFIMKWVKRAAIASPWRGDNIIVTSMRGIPVFWGAAAGMYLATFTIRPPYVWIAEDLQAVIKVAILLSVTIVAARIASGFVTTYAGRDGTFLPSTSLIPTLIRIMVYVLGGLVILHTLAIEIAPILTTLGIGGLAVALALQDTLSNVFAGLYLIAAKQIRPGDYVQLEEDKEGYVMDINWRSATVRTIHENMVIVPNQTLASSIVTNFNQPRKELLIRMAVGVEYGSDLEFVEEVTLEVARDTMRVLTGTTDTYEPLVYYQTFGEFSINFIVFLRAPEFFDRYRARHVFIKKLVRRYQEEEIRIPFPIKEFEMELSTGGLEHGELRASEAMESAVESDAPASKEDRNGAD